MLAERLSMLREELLEEGRQKGRQEGRQKGRLEGLMEGEQRGLRAGEVRVLMRQLELKFGQVGAQVRERIEGASADEILLWGERVLTADSLDEVFTP